MIGREVVASAGTAAFSRMVEEQRGVKEGAEGKRGINKALVEGAMLARVAASGTWAACPVS